MAYPDPPSKKDNYKFIVNIKEKEEEEAIILFSHTIVFLKKAINKYNLHFFKNIF